MGCGREVFDVQLRQQMEKDKEMEHKKLEQKVKQMLQEQYAYCCTGVRLYNRTPVQQYACTNVHLYNSMHTVVQVYTCTTVCLYNRMPVQASLYEEPYLRMKLYL